MLAAPRTGSFFCRGQLVTAPECPLFALVAVGTVGRTNPLTLPGFDLPAGIAGERPVIATGRTWKKPGTKPRRLNSIARHDGTAAKAVIDAQSWDVETLAN